MRLQLFLIVVVSVVLFWCVGCGSSGGSGGGSTDVPAPSVGDDGPGGGSPVGEVEGGPAGGPGNDCSEGPVLQAVEGIDGEICAGSQITLVGINFSPDLSQNEVLFHAGNNTRMQGLPLEVVFPSDGDCTNGLESRLVVAVPGGVVSGDVMLRVGGLNAGGSSYGACPQIMGYELGRFGSRPTLEFLELLGTFDRNAYIRLIGINFEALSEIVLEDSQGTLFRIPAERLVRNPLDARPDSGYSVVGFPLNDDTTQVRLLIEGPRDNVRVQAVGQSAASNVLQVPVTVNEDPELVFNGVQVPTGAVSGGVRVRYSLYEQAVSAAYELIAEWRPAASVIPDSPWFPAAALESDPKHDGVEGILPGNFAQEIDHGLFPARGKVLTFTWSPEVDANFPPQGGEVGGVVRNVWPVEFRLSARVTAGARRPVTQSMVTPTVLYVDLSDDNGESLREAVFVENFLDTDGEDAAETTAEWGNPRGSLRGSLPEDGEVVNVFGEGVRALVLNPPRKPSGESEDTVIDEFQFDTTRRRLTFVRRMLNDPQDPTDDVVQASRVNLDGVPGEDAGEFHFRTLTIKADSTVRARGERPLVIRLSGTGNVDEPAFVLEPGAVIDLSGEDGEIAPRVLLGTNRADFSPGRGGAGGAGAGDGGDGADIELVDEASPTVVRVVEAGAGGNAGGGGGETTTAVDFGLGETTNTSQISGGPGGGGGNRQRGGAGDPGIPAPIEYAPPRGGAGGAARGGPSLSDLAAVAGSGGGGGGAALSGNRDGEFQSVGGPGGGGGGGAVHVVADGSMQIEGRIVAEGGAGGKGNSRIFPPGGTANGRSTGEAAPGAGGGGSGGAILLQATGSIEVECSQLSVEGGRHGLSGAGSNEVVSEFGDQNFLPGAGDGSPGWIRVEANVAGVPSCSVLRAESALSEQLDADETEELFLFDARAFPASGTLVVEQARFQPGVGQVSRREEIGYSLNTIDPGDDGTRVLAKLERALDGEGPFGFTVGARVFLKTGLVPALRGSVLSEGEVVEAPGEIPANAGREGSLHFPYRPSSDPETGEPVLDPETGEALSIYRMNTDTGVILGPAGNVFRQGPAMDTNVLDVRHLRIPPGVVLRATGTLPLAIFVAESAEIEGRIDVSGHDGGLLRFDRARPDSPLPGTGGLGGPAGGAGGLGATISHRDGDPSNSDPANVSALVSGRGRLPENTPAGFVEADSLVGDGGLEDVHAPIGGVIVRPGGGDSVLDPTCDTEGEPVLCEPTAGGGAGGSNRNGGEAGQSLPEVSTRGGEPGSPFGVESLHLAGELWLSGGIGGGGGGASAQVSEDYRAGRAGESLTRAQALFAPGTGGGGGGGVLYLVCTDFLLRSSGKILARGGNAFQSIDLGGGGGGGAGGNVILQIRATVTIESGGTIDVSGGEANLPVPVRADVGLPPYEGSIRLVGEFGQTLQVFGGLGGRGAPGRVRIEADGQSLAADSGRAAPNPNLFAGRFEPAAYHSVAVSQPIALGVGRSLHVRSAFVELQTPVVLFDALGIPSGTDVVVLWEGAARSLDAHAGFDAFSPAANDVRALGNVESVRFRVLLRANVESGTRPALRSISLPYELPLPALVADEIEVF